MDRESPAIGVHETVYCLLRGQLYGAQGASSGKLSQRISPHVDCGADRGWLLLLEPDFGSFVVITAIMMAILFLGGMDLKLFAGLIGFLVAGLLALIWIEPYRMQRFFGFMDPWDDPYGKGYQLSHALIAFGRGEWLGVGLGGSVEKLFYLPEAHTDFLLAVIAEELGFAGVATVCRCLPGW